MAVVDISNTYQLTNVGAHIDNTDVINSNRNLLDNPFFTVNQRSATTVTLNGTDAYIADRWIAGSFGTYTHNSDNTITITCPNSTAFAGLTQRIDPIYKGGTYTYSVRLSDDTVISLQGTMPSGRGLNVYNITINGVSWQALFRSDGSIYWITLRCNVANTTATVKAVKLELGSVSTLANDSPPAYEQALSACQYRCVVYESMPTNFLFCRGVATTTTNLRAVIDLPRSMAKDKVPTVTITGNLTTPQGNTITAMSSASTVVRGNKLVVNCTTSGLTGGNTYDISTGNGGQTITISADL